MVLADVLPHGPVEQPLAPEVQVCNRLGLVDLRPCDDLAFEVALEVVLEAEENNVLPVAAPRLVVRVDGLGFWRILLPVGDLVTVGQQDQIV